MPDRRSLDKDTDVREEVADRVKHDPRRDGTGPNLWSTVIFEMQKELMDLKRRVGELEQELTKERERARKKPSDPPSAESRSVPTARLSDPPIAYKPTKQLRAATRRPPPQSDREDALDSKATRQLRAPSRRPPPSVDRDELAEKPTKQFRVPSRRPPAMTKK